MNVTEGIKARDNRPNTTNNGKTLMRISRSSAGKTTEERL